MILLQTIEPSQRILSASKVYLNHTEYLALGFSDHIKICDLNLQELHKFYTFAPVEQIIPLCNSFLCFSVNFSILISFNKKFLYTKKRICVNSIKKITGFSKSISTKNYFVLKSNENSLIVGYKNENDYIFDESICDFTFLEVIDFTGDLNKLCVIFKGFERMKKNFSENLSFDPFLVIYKYGNKKLIAVETVQLKSIYKIMYLKNELFLISKDYLHVLEDDKKRKGAKYDGASANENVVDAAIEVKQKKNTKKASKVVQVCKIPHENIIDHLTHENSLFLLCANRELLCFSNNAFVSYGFLDFYIDKLIFLYDNTYFGASYNDNSIMFELRKQKIVNKQERIAKLESKQERIVPEQGRNVIGPDHSLSNDIKLNLAFKNKSIDILTELINEPIQNKLSLYKNTLIMKKGYNKNHLCTISEGIKLKTEKEITFKHRIISLHAFESLLFVSFANSFVIYDYKKAKTVQTYKNCIQNFYIQKKYSEEKCDEEMNDNNEFKKANTHVQYSEGSNTPIQSDAGLHTYAQCDAVSNTYAYSQPEPVNSLKHNLDNKEKAFYSLSLHSNKTRSKANEYFLLNTQNEFITKNEIYSTDYKILLSSFYKNLKLIFGRRNSDKILFLCDEETIINEKITKFNVSLILLSKSVFLSTFDDQFYVLDYKFNVLHSIKIETFFFGFVIADSENFHGACESKNNAGIRTARNNAGSTCESRNNACIYEVKNNAAIHELKNNTGTCCNKTSVDKCSCDVSQAYCIFITQNGRFYIYNGKFTNILNIPETIMKVTQIRTDFFVKGQNKYILRVKDNEKFDTGVVNLHFKFSLDKIINKDVECLANSKTKIFYSVKNKIYTTKSNLKSKAHKKTKKYENEICEVLQDNDMKIMVFLKHSSKNTKTVCVLYNKNKKIDKLVIPGIYKTSKISPFSMHNETCSMKKNVSHNFKEAEPDKDNKRHKFDTDDSTASSDRSFINITYDNTQNNCKNAYFAKKRFFLCINFLKPEICNKIFVIDFDKKFNVLCEIANSFLLHSFDVLKNLILIGLDRKILICKQSGNEINEVGVIRNIVLPRNITIMEDKNVFTMSCENENTPNDATSSLNTKCSGTTREHYDNEDLGYEKYAKNPTVRDAVKTSQEYRYDKDLNYNLYAKNTTIGDVVSTNVIRNCGTGNKECIYNNNPATKSHSLGFIFVLNGAFATMIYHLSRDNILTEKCALKKNYQKCIKYDDNTILLCKNRKMCYFDIKNCKIIDEVKMAENIIDIQCDNSELCKTNDIQPNPNAIKKDVYVLTALGSIKKLIKSESILTDAEALELKNLQDKIVKNDNFLYNFEANANVLFLDILKEELCDKKNLSECEKSVYKKVKKIIKR